MKLSILFAAGAVILLVICAEGAYLASGVSSAELPAGMWLAYGVGVFLTVTIGSGLFALTFYSARHGYDDIDRPEDGPAG